MIKIRITFLGILFFAIFLGEIHAGEFAHRSGRQIYLPSGEKLLMRGINLGNWLVPEGYMFKFKKMNSPRLINTVLSELIGPAATRRFWKKYRQNYITEADVHFLKESGVNTLRIPFNYRLFTPEAYPDIWLNDGFEMLDRIVAWAKKEQIWLIFDMHCAPGGQTGDNIDDSWGWPWLFESTESQQRAAEIWRRIAQRYADEPIVLGYDLLNEPVPHWDEVQRLNERVVPAYRTIARAIREVDQKHMLFFGGARWNTNFTIFDQPIDENSAYTFHKYWNEVTTASIQSFLDFRTKFNVPIWLGESGENRDGWIDSCTTLMEKHDIGYVYWPYKKMNATSCMVTFPQPEGYEIIINYAEKRGNTFAQRRNLLPGRGKVEKILAQYLENCLFQNCRTNMGYLKAMHLEPVQ